MARSGVTERIPVLRETEVCQKLRPVFCQFSGEPQHAKAQPSGGRPIPMAGWSSRSRVVAHPGAESIFSIPSGAISIHSDGLARREPKVSPPSPSERGQQVSPSKAPDRRLAGDQMIIARSSDKRKQIVEIRSRRSAAIPLRPRRTRHRVRRGRPCQSSADLVPAEGDLGARGLAGMIGRPLGSAFFLDRLAAATGRNPRLRADPSTIEG